MRAVVDSGAGPETVEAQLVSANYFEILGVAPRQGRPFSPPEEGTPVVVLGDSFGTRAFGQDAAVLGRTLRIGKTAFTIVGVMPESLTGTSLLSPPPDVWVPAGMQEQIAPGSDWLHSPADGRFQIFARLGRGIRLEGAQSDADRLLRRFASTFVEPDRTIKVSLEHTSLLGNTDDIRFQALIAGFMLVVGLVLLTACANLANMLLARGAARQREIAVRLALGAGRARIVRQLLTESLLLATIGGAAGLGLSVWSSRLLWAEIAPLAVGLGGGFAQRVNLNPDLRVFAYALGVSLIAAMLFGISPAIQTTQTDIAIALKGEVSAFGRRLSRSRMRRLLLATQVAVSMVLLLFAGLLARGLIRSGHASTGFRTDGVLVLTADFGDDAPRAASRERRLVDGLRRVPGIAEVAIGSVPYMGTWTPPIVPGGRTLGSYASESYFQLMGIPVRGGRVFTRDEAASGAPVAVISAATAAIAWPGEDPIGRRFNLDRTLRGEIKTLELIGVVGDTRFANLTRADPSHVYLPAGAQPRPIVMRASGSARSALTAVRSAVAELDPPLISGLDLVSLEGPIRLQRTMAGAFALCAVVLGLLALAVAGLGIYGVMAYLVRQRTREIGLRMALGATPGRVLLAIFLEGLWPVWRGMLLGLVVALAISWGLHRALAIPGSSDLLYGTPFYDPVTFGGIAAFMVLVAATASAVPARRALRVEPVEALRCE